MELAPRYCRSCGSRILVKNVCHNCNNDPLKGENYCYDCGALTPDADNCSNCGARYKTNLPIKPMLIIAGIFIAVVAVAGFFLTRQNSSVSAEEDKHEVTKTEPPVQELTNKDTIVNKPDTSVLVNKPADTLLTSTVPTPVIKDTASVAKDTTKRLSLNIIGSDEMRGYGSRCSYFLKAQRGQVMFFKSGGSAFIKNNGKLYELKRKRKGTDVETFGNSDYEAVIRIDGLSGSEKEWLASCTLVVKDLVNNTSTRHKVYSTCIEL